MKRLLCAIIPGIICLQLAAADIYVDYNKGKRRNPGTKEAPLPTFAHAFNKAKPGDTIYILPSPQPIRDTIVVRTKSGVAGKPITIDGMNNIFLGTMPLDPKKWKEIKPGYFACKVQTGFNMANRYYMVWNGKINRMGRYNKARCNVRWKAVDALQPGEWTIVRGSRVDPNSKRPHPLYNFDYVLRLPEGMKTPAEAKIEEPLTRRISGVNIAKDCNYITFRNIIVKNFLNDGFNIHGNCRNIRFENIAAVECGDDGISAHETSEIFVKNFVAIACSTGACHINKAECHHENVYFERILGKDLFFTQNSWNTFKNVWVKGHSVEGFSLTTRPDCFQRFSIENARMINYNKRAVFSLFNQGKIDIKFNNVKIANYSKVNKAYQVLQVKPEDIEAEINAARKQLFSIFGGQLEKALGE